MVISKAFQDFSQNVDLLSTASPWMECFSLNGIQPGSSSDSDLPHLWYCSNLLHTLAAIDNREISLQMVIWLRSLFLGRGTMMLVIHWAGGVRFKFTSAQKQCMYICHCINATLESLCGDSIVKSSCLVGLHLANGFQCLIKCRWVIMDRQFAHIP